jgi:tRNA U34 2-thiouridine synthase MnmA/TrmU
MAKCLLLFSGGLDSLLSGRILLEQKIKVTPVCFKSYFFDCDLAEKFVKELGLKLKIIDISEKQLEIVRNPEYGRGKGLNPCIDCHLLMIKEAKRIMEKEKFDFLVTGEVLGERPFSQRKEILKLIEEKAGLTGLILRPLSAKLLDPTMPEKRGWIDRTKLFSIKGKSRKPQISLAKKFKIKKFPNPSGGCLLTDPQYAEKLNSLMKKNPAFDGNDAEILRKGRIFWEEGFLIAVGRNKKENGELKKLKKKRDRILEPYNFPGPTVLVREFNKKIKKEILNKTKKLLIKYSKKLPEKPKINEL